MKPALDEECSLNAPNPLAVETQVAATSADDRWLGYLRSLPSRGLVAEGLAQATERFWTALRDALGAVAPPNASPTDDEGLRLSWTAQRRYLEIELSANGAYEWFYRDTAVRESDFGQGLSSDPVPEHLVARLRGLHG